MFDHARQSHHARTAHRFKRKQPEQSSNLVRWQHRERTQTTRKKNQVQPSTKQPSQPSLKHSHRANSGTESLPLLSHPTSVTTKRILIVIALCCLSLTTLEILFVTPASIAHFGLPQLYLPFLLPIFIGLFCLARLKTTSALAILPAAGVTMIISLQLQQVVIAWQTVAAICCILSFGAGLGILLRKLVLL